MPAILDGTNGVTFGDGSVLPSIPRSILTGLALSTAGASAIMSIAAGQTADSSNAVVMNTAATSKTTTAWALGAGNGGLDTGAIANNSWYHFYLIRRADTGIVDAIFSLSASAPTLPANYTQYRRIGSGRINGSAQWVKFVQNGDEFLWDAPSADVNYTGATTIQTQVLLTPLGLKTNALLSVGGITGAASDGRAFVFSPDTNSGAALAGLGNINAGASGSGVQGWSELNIRTNTSSQISFALAAANGSLIVNTKGWIDTRGRNL